MSATDIWIKDLDALENAWNEFLESGKVNGNYQHQQSHNSNNVVIDVDTYSEINDVETDNGIESEEGTF